MSADLWQRAEAHWLRMCPDLPRGGFNPPATERQIAAVEALIGQRFPDDLREAYLHFNGMALRHYSEPNRPALIENYFHWQDLASVAIHWTNERVCALQADFEIDVHEGANQPIVSTVWHPGWIPIGLSGTPDTLYVDLVPGLAGRFGQIFQTDFVNSDEIPVLAQSFSASVAKTVDALDRGAIVLQGGYLVHANNPSKAWCREELW